MISVRRTCRAFPSQWDADDDDGTCWYIRFGHGWLTVDHAPSSEAMDDPTDPDQYQVIGCEIEGDGAEGFGPEAMSTAQMVGIVWPDRPQSGQTLDTTQILCV